MTAPTTPTAENIRPGQVIVVQGAISFARTASLIDGVELQRRVASSKSQYPTDSPHTLMVLSQAEIVPADPTQYSWEESYVKSLFFEHKKNPEKGLGYEAKNVTKSLPTLLTVDPENPGSYRQVVDVEGEIARDTVVRIVVVTYQSKDKNGREYQKLGLGLEAIILSTPEVPYAPKSGARNLDLSSYGITLSTPLVATNGVETEVPNQIVRTDASGLPAAPVAPSAPVQPVAAPAPVASAAPAAPSAPLAPAAPVAPIQPAAAAHPAAPSAPAAPAAPMAPVQPIVPVAAAYQVAAPGAAAGNPDDPFAGTPSPSWGGAGIQVPA